MWDAKDDRTPSLFAYEKGGSCLQRFLMPMSRQSSTLKLFLQSKV